MTLEASRCSCFESLESSDTFQEQGQGLKFAGSYGRGKGSDPGFFPDPANFLSLPHEALPVSILSKGGNRSYRVDAPLRRISHAPINENSLGAGFYSEDVGRESRD